MPEMIKITCEFCENPMSVKEELAGKKIKCPKCATVIEVKAPEVESSEEEKPEPKPAAEAGGGGGFHMTRMLSAPTFKRKKSSGPKIKVEATKDKTPLIIGGVLVFLTFVVLLLVLWFVVLKKPASPVVAKPATVSTTPVK